MRKKNNWHGSHTGSKFQEMVCNQLNELGIEYTEEKIAHSKATAKTRRGKFDIKFLNWCLELKSTAKTSLDFCLYSEEKKSVKIHGHQLTALYKEWFTNGKESGLILEFRPHKPVFVHIKDFYKWAIQTPRKSINRATALNIGKEIDHIKELIE